MKKTTTLFALMTILFVSRAQTIERLITDSTSERATDPSSLTILGNEMFFVAKQEASTFWALYKTDGTDAGTVVVSKLNDNAMEPKSLIAHNNKLYFEAYDNHGWEPWVSDGTEAGTTLLKDMRPGSIGGGFIPLGGLGNYVYFMSTNNGVYGIWKTDGTSAGTTLVVNSVSTQASINFNGKIYVWATIAGEYGMYSIDQSSSIQLVKKFKAGNNSSAPIAVGSNKFYFAANDSISGIEPWVSDGTAAGTFMLKDILAGSGSSLDMGGSGSFTTMVIFNDKLYFNPATGSGRAIWTSDGTTAGTVSVTSSIGFNPTRFCVSGGKLYFNVENPERVGVSDGTAAGTVLLQPASNTSGVKNFGYFIPYNGKVVFAGIPITQEQIGQEPWISDGTNDGTKMLMDINPQAYSASVEFGGSERSAMLLYKVFKNKLFFACRNGKEANKLWIINDAGTTGISDINKQAFNGVLVYPNPATNQITFTHLNRSAVVKLVDITGREVLRQGVEATASIDISSLKAGVYMYVISSGEDHITGRFTKY